MFLTRVSQRTSRTRVPIVWRANLILKGNAQSVSNCRSLSSPTSHATPGVLTKPDRIPDGEHAHWLPFIRNEKEPLDNNWFCVKQPSSIDMKQKITWEDARKREDEYFSLTAPWNELDSTYLKYLRTRNLVDRLSSVLSDLIAKRCASLL